jgi:hypothetical protein
MVNGIKDLKSGKGGPCYEGPGVKHMSARHPKLDTASPSKMSSAHGLTGHTPKSHNMNQGGGNRIGANCPTFGKSNYRQAGPKGGNTRHASQPSGHKSKA